MDAKEQLYQLYVEYFDRRAQSSKKANEFTSSVGADHLQIEKLTEEQFFAYLGRPSPHPATKRRWIGRILKGHEDEIQNTDLLLQRILPPTPVRRRA